MAQLRPNQIDRWLLAGLMAVIGWFYFWTAIPAWRPELASKDGPGYYNLLVRGFMKGQLSLDQEADPFLATLKDPTDPSQRVGHGMFDVSYYRGRYYLYWGVTPAVVLFLPFRVVTGRFLDESLAPPFFAWVGFVASVWLLFSVRRRYFPSATAWVVLGCVLALGLANMMPVLLRRSGVYEVPITCGYACCMVGLAAIFQALEGRRQLASLAIAATMFGLAVGSRPLYVFSCAALLPVLWVEARDRRLGFGAWRDAGWRRLAFAALAPLAILGSVLAAYNFLRFGSLTDFGLRHQMTGHHITHLPYFGWRFLFYNLRVYGFAPAGWSPYFPFVQPAALPAYPEGNLGYEDPYGMLVNIPFVLCAAGLLVSNCSGRATALFLSVVFASAGTGIAMAFFGSATNRYMVDFLPAIVLLACFGLMAMVVCWKLRGLWRVVGTFGMVGVLGYSIVFNVLASLVHNDLFRTEQPAAYRRLATICNWPSYAVDLALGTSYGPIEIKVRFPQGAEHSLEPLVATGHSVLSDYLVVNYLGRDRIQFGLEHTSRGSFFGEPVNCRPGDIHTVRIDMGSLYPPRDHPYFRKLTPAEALLRQETLRVTFDGKVVLDTRLRFYDADSREPSVGSSAGRPGFGRPFSGELVAVRRLKDTVLTPTLVQHGPVGFDLRFPQFSGVRSEPLLASGENGRGDLVYVRYEGPGLVSFGYDHWGRGGAQGNPVPFDPAAVQHITIDSGVLHAPDLGKPGDSELTGRLVVRLNEKVVLDVAAPYYRSGPHSVWFGFNAIEASSAEPKFSGEIIRSVRLPESPASPP